MGKLSQFLKEHQQQKTREWPQPAQYKVNHLNDPITSIKESEFQTQKPNNKQIKTSRKKYFVEMVSLENSTEL